MKLTISRGNMKVGKIPNVSLPPVKTCSKKLPCYKECYAMKSYRQYPNVKKAWDNNLKLWQKSPADFTEQLDDYLTKHKPDYFRWHVGGDIPDKKYFNMMCSIAILNPGTMFLAFTKRYEYAPLATPINFSVVFSRWPGLQVTNGVENCRQAWLVNPKKMDVYIPKDVLPCPGSCTKCKLCWTGKGDIAFLKH